MSKLIIEIHSISDIKKHPDPETTGLEVITVGGWDVVSRKGIHQINDRVLFVPPDSLVTVKFADMAGVTKYLGKLPKDHSLYETHLKVKAARLRGCPSFGFIVKEQDLKDFLGIDNLNDLELQTTLDIQKWEPPPIKVDGDTVQSNALFQKYTDIQNIRNYPNIIENNEPVVVLEKIHGSSLRVGVILSSQDGYYEYVCGSHNLQRKVSPDCVYALPLYENDQVKFLIADLTKKDTKSVTVYGELYGKQGGMRYGTDGHPRFAVFDISVDNKYLDWDDVVAVCNKFNIPIVPEIYRGPYSFDKVIEHTSGPILITDHTKLKDFKYREGVVVKPLKERVHPRIGRVIFKSISPEYLEKSDKIVDSH